VTMNRMRCKPADGNAWTTVRVRELRERLGIGSFDPTLPRAETISADAAAIRLGICVGSLHKLIRKGGLPATQLMQSAPWQIPVAALETEATRQSYAKSSAVAPSSTSAFRRIKPFGSPDSEWRDALCRPVPSAASKDVKIARVWVAAQCLLHLQCQPIHAFPHVGPADRQPHPNPARNRDHRRASASTTADAKAGDTEAGIRTWALPAKSISIAGTGAMARPSPAGATST
jgi:hypothetical protein